MHPTNQAYDTPVLEHQPSLSLLIRQAASLKPKPARNKQGTLFPKLEEVQANEITRLAGKQHLPRPVKRQKQRIPGRVFVVDQDDPLQHNQRKLQEAMLRRKDIRQLNINREPH